MKKLTKEQQKEMAWETMLLNAIKQQNSRHLTGEKKMMITP